MTDGIIKGTGNSRYLKSVANALALYPTHESLMEALAAGTLPIDLNGINPAGWNTVGDKLDKATLLTDALCSALGLATTATPTQAMEKLRQLVNTAQNTADGKIKVAFGSYVGNGELSRQLILPAYSYATIIMTDYGETCSGDHYTYGGILSNGYSLKSFNGNNAATQSGALITLYNNQYGDRQQLNVTNTTYYYICFY